MQTMPLLQIDDVVRRFATPDGTLIANDHVSLEIEAGEFFCLLGPSGCGKTVLLRMIADFDAPDAGRILLDGKDLAGTAPEQRPSHTVFQSYALFPHMTVAANVAFPLKMAKRPAAGIPVMVKEVLDKVHLVDKSDRFPHELSGDRSSALHSRTRL